MSDRLNQRPTAAGRRGRSPYPVHVLAAAGSGWGELRICYREYPLAVYAWMERGYWNVLVRNWFWSRASWDRVTSEGRCEMGAKFIKTALASLAKGTTLEMASDAELGRSCPAVVEFLTSGADGAGKARQTSTLMVCTGDGQWKVCLNERDADVSLWATGETLQKALQALEQRLVAPVVEWRRKTPPKPKRGR